MEAAPLDRLWERGRTSLRARLQRVHAKACRLASAVIAAGVAWFIAADLLGHPTPFFAPVAAVVALGTSYGQRLRRVAEVTVGVAVGIFLADLLVVWLGSGAWQIADRGAVHDRRLPARRRPAVRDPGRGAVDRDRGARGWTGPGLHPVDRRRHRRARGAGRGNGRARGAAAATPEQAALVAARSPRCCAPPAG